MPTFYIALYKRLIGKKSQYIIWEAGFFPSKRSIVFNSFRLMKKYAKKQGYIVKDSYVRDIFYVQGV